MDFPSGSNDAIEARFRLQTFAFLRSPDSLRQLLRSADLAQCSALRLELARFLAAYYLNFNFGAFFANIHKILPKAEISTTTSATHQPTLPNLLLWAEFNEEWRNDEGTREEEERERRVMVWGRSHLGQLLSSEYSPGLALRILLREGRILEAIFFADHFNDSRTAMALRFLADSTFRLNLFPDFCRQFLVDQLLVAIEYGDRPAEWADGDNGHPESMEKFIKRQIEGALQADVLFADQFGGRGEGGGLVRNLIGQCARLMTAQFGQLFSDDDDEILPECVVKQLSPFLPRPPIYSAPMAEGQSNCDPESLVWTKLRHSFLAISLALSRSNRLDQLIAFFALWLAQSQNKSNEEDDLALLVQSQFFMGLSDDELRHDLGAIQTMFSAVVGMDLRDKMVRMMAQGTTKGEELEKCREKLLALIEPFRGGKRKGWNGNGLIWNNLKRWAKMADGSDLDGAALFLHILQQRNQPNRGFLPPLTALSSPKWYFLLLSDMPKSTRRNDGGDNLNVFIGDEHKFKMNRPDLVRLRYLLRHFPAIPMGPSSIQMLLELNPDEFCIQMDQIDVPNSKDRNESGGQQLIEVLNEFQAKSNVPMLIGVRKEGKDDGKREMGEEKKEDGLEELVEQIRASIRRLELLEDKQMVRKEEEKLLTEKGVERSTSEMEEKRRRRRMNNNSSAERRRRIWREDKPRTSQSSKEKRDQTYAAFMKARLERDGEELASERSNSTTTPISSSSGTFSSVKERRSEARGHESSEKESAFESMDENEREEEATDEVLMKEMEEVGQRLEWIRAQFTKRKDDVLDGEEKEYDGENGGRLMNRREEGGRIREIDDSGWIEDEAEDEGMQRRSLIAKESKSDVSELENDGREEKNRENQNEDPHNGEHLEEEGQGQGFIPSARVPSSAGYHSSISSPAGRTHRIEMKEEDFGERGGGGTMELMEEEQWWEKGRTMTMNVVVERMDFNRLLTSDSEEEMLTNKGHDDDDEGEGGMVPPTITMKKAARKWTEIEVFPRNISPKEERERMEVVRMPKEEKPNKAKKQWRPPNWLRLLPPFDGSIRTERRMAKREQRPLLQLKLEGLDALSGGMGTSRRTFLDMAKRDVEKKKAIKKDGIKICNEVEKGQRTMPKEGSMEQTIEQIQQEQVQHQPSGIYDSGIGLDQTTAGGGNIARQQHNICNNNINNNSMVVLYSAEMEADEIERMRRMASNKM